MPSFATHSRRRLFAPELWLCWSNLFLAVAILWAIPRGADDLHVGLAAGREILGGRLGAPDDWAFTTNGRVWLNQNWGTHLLLYLVHVVGGEVGLLVLKAVLCVAVAGCLLVSCRARGVPWAAPLLVTVALLLAMRTYVDLRPNLLTLLAAPLVSSLVCLGRRRSDLAWIVALVIAVWANLHAGFMLGLGMLVLWTACLLAAATRRRGLGEGLRRCRPWVVATAAAVALAALANPFGIENLTHPFVVARSPLWRNVAEWAPMFAPASRSRYAAHLSTWELWAALASLTLALSARVVTTARRRRRRARGTRLREGQLAVVLFDAGLIAATVTMTFQSRRFLPLALMAIAPACAVHGSWLLRSLSRRWATAAASLCLLVLSLLLAHALAMRYRADNPLFPPESLFRRMTGSRSFYSGAVDFINANGLSGRVYNAWAWEGYLRWRRAPLQLFIGARAQQVYDEQTFATFLQIQAAHQSPRAALAALQVHLAVVPMDEQYAPFFRTITRELGTRWVYVYADGQWAVLSDAGSPETATLVENVAAGQAWYPEEAIAAQSRAMYLASPAVGADPKQVRAALVAASELRPSAHAYFTLGELTLDDKLAMKASVDYLTAEADRLAKIATDQPLGVDVLYCRRVIASMLAALHESSGRSEAATAARKEERELADRIGALVNAWGYGET